MYAGISVRPLSSECALVRFAEEPQMFAIEFSDGCPIHALMKVLSNVEACVLVRGCVLAVDLISVVHETSERTCIPLQSNLIAASAFTEPLKEWMYIGKDGSQVGPMEKDDIRRLWSKKAIDWTTRFWASGMLDWKKLCDIRELRWALASRVPVITPPQVDHVLAGRYVIHII